MGRQRLAAIARLADVVRSALTSGEHPHDPDTIANGLGGDVAEVHGMDHEAVVEKRGERAFLVRIRPDLPAARRRFTVAHELGHLFIHMGYLVNPARWLTTGSYEDSPFARFGHGEEDHEADVFAGALLMPGPEFGRVSAQHLRDRKYAIQPIADAFGVSTAMATARGRYLRLFAWD